MKVIFISGKYRAKTEWELEQNIQKAEQRAATLWQLGWAVICPHKNSAHFGGLCDDDIWLMGDIEILKRCDAIYMLPNWRESEGAVAEHKIAEDSHLQIIYELE